jgi:flagellar biosynthesis protein FlhA
MTRLTKRKPILVFVFAFVFLCFNFLCPSDLLIEMLMVISISFGFLILLRAMLVQKSINFSSFPTLLFASSFLRLLLSFSVSTQILLKGKEISSNLINTYRNFTLYGNESDPHSIEDLITLFVLQLVIFLSIAFTTRFSAVYSRFMIDGLPQKWMSIDIQFSSDLISESEAQRKKNLMERDTDFLQEVDGACTFVKWEAWTSIVINLMVLTSCVLISSIFRGEMLLYSLLIYSELANILGIAYVSSLILSLMAVFFIILKRG